MEGSEPRDHELFRFFVLQQQMAAMMYLGKMVRPDTGQMERSLEAAQLSIDMLGMLEEKTKGNLTKDEERLLQQVLTTLRLNYLDEAKRGETPPPEPEKEADETTPDAAPPGSGDAA